ncbi:MAG: EF-P lysine aminoacylase EpmA [Bythopirellula sp.]|nr:EF-P lysine aminoacylase EpmA [Bythopirellula sp.]
MNDRPNILKRRSELLRKLREFFYERNFVEVETPLLSEEVIPELHIEPPKVQSRDRAPIRSNGRRHTAQFLQASPELHMKRLVAEGMSAIFQVTRSFRSGEYGKLHNPEFTIVEWYRVGDDMQAGMTLLDELCQSLLNTPPAIRTSYAEAFQTHLDICPHKASCEELAACAEQHGAAAQGIDTADLDEWLNLLLATQIEPRLGLQGPEILHDYPASQASLAKIVMRESCSEVAERFELYWQGVELANGFHELTDAAELRARFMEVNAARVADNRPALPLPESLLTALEQGLPNSAGCALGFDRLVMLAIGAESIGEVMAFHAKPS